jgi:hypothetical protein
MRYLCSENIYFSVSEILITCIFSVSEIGIFSVSEIFIISMSETLSVSAYFLSE